MPKKKAKPQSWLLANSPDDNNSCQCFHRAVPDNNWIVVARFASEQECRQTLPQCNQFFMQKPLKYPRARMGMAHMGMRRGRRGMR